MKSNIQVLESDQGWLNKRLINIGQKLLHEKSSQLLSNFMMWVVQTLLLTKRKTRNSVQILNVRRSHWVCV